MSVANGKEAIVRIPVVVPPIEVEVPLGVVLVEVRHVPVAVNLSNGALYEKPSMALSVNIFANISGLYRIRDLFSLPGFSHQQSLIF